MRLNVIITKGANPAIGHLFYESQASHLRHCWCKEAKAYRAKTLMRIATPLPRTRMHPKNKLTPYTTTSLLKPEGELQG